MFMTASPTANRHKLKGLLILCLGKLTIYHGLTHKAVSPIETVKVFSF